jgi:hypothetical protein
MAGKDRPDMGSVPMLVRFERLRARGCITGRPAVTLRTTDSGHGPKAYQCRFSRALQQLPLLSVIDGLSLSNGIVSAPQALAVRPVQPPA